MILQAHKFKDESLDLNNQLPEMLENKKSGLSEQKHIDYVKSIYRSLLKDVRDMFNNKFGTNISKNAINAKMNRLGVKSGVSPYGSRQAY
ncbi:hypothetical protein ACVPOS_12565 [Staphylococcus aureus]